MLNQSLFLLKLCEVRPLWCVLQAWKSDMVHQMMLSPWRERKAREKARARKESPKARTLVALGVVLGSHLNRCRRLHKVQGKSWLNSRRRVLGMPMGNSDWRRGHLSRNCFFFPQCRIAENSCGHVHASSVQKSVTLAACLESQQTQNTNKNTTKTPKTPRPTTNICEEIALK